MKRKTLALSRAASATIIIIVIIIVIGAVTIANTVVAAERQPAGVTSTATTDTLQSPGSSTASSLQFPGVNAVNQTPTSRYFTLTWELSPQALQDRFTPFNMIVAQGDTVHVTFIVNDSVAHTFTIGSPYDYQMNVSAPGLKNDLTGQTFTQSATGNSPGVVISGTPGNLTGTGSFVARYPGVFEYFCVYHVQIGMFGYLIVLPNAAYATNTTASTAATAALSTSGVPTPSGQVGIVLGSAANTTSVYYSPEVITVVLGKNATVTWVNNDIAPHTVTSDAPGEFDSRAINSRASWSYTFTTPGTFAYHCSYHPWMHGIVIVVAGSASNSTTT